ncbi:MAG: polysaccharide biosynthesis tyrosine autokinase [Mesorhizobium sp.]
MLQRADHPLPGHPQYPVPADGYPAPPGYYAPAGYGYGYAEREEGFDPLAILFRIIQYRWLIGSLAAIGLVAALVATMMMTPQYRSAAMLEVQVPSARVFQDIEVTSETSDMRTFLTAREKLKSRALAERVVFALQLADKEDFLFPRANFSPLNLLYRAFRISSTKSIEDVAPEEREQIATRRIMGELTVDLVPNTSLLRISYSDQNPDYARNIANQFAQSFIDQRVDQGSATSVQARQFIQEQVLQVKEKLQGSEEALVEYAKTAGITVTGDERSLISASLSEINKGLSAAVQESLDYGRLVQQIEAGRGASLEQVLSSEGLDKLRGRVAELKGEYQQKLSLYKPGFPEMQQLSSQIREIENQLNQGVLAITDSIQLKHQETLVKVEDLRKELAELEAEQAAYQDKNIQYTILKREVDSNRAQYDSLISKLNEVAVGSELKTQNASIVDLAVLPNRPYSPRLLLNLAIGLLLSLGLAAAIVYLLELLNNKFSNPEQVEKELGLAILGIIPVVNEKDLASALEDQKSGLSESYRSLRTSLQFSGADGLPKTLLVTSSEPAEGKSTTAYKLAEDFGSLGTNVLVIDGDMRKPNLHRLFNVDNAIGLSNLLTSTVHKDDMARVIKQGKSKNVSIITAGTIPPNPADLLSSARMGMMISILSKRYDVVIIDGPPVIGISDAPILSCLTEATLLVVSANQVSRKSARMALKRLKATGANVIGATMMKFTVGKFDYNYSYRYLNYDYYNYGKDTPRLAGTAVAGEPSRNASTRSFGSFGAGLRRRLDDLVNRIKSDS